MTGFLKPFHSFTQSHVDTKLIIAYFFYCVQRSKIGGMCMSEPNAGTDVLGMKSNAVYDPTRGGYILNGTKVSKNQLFSFAHVFVQGMNHERMIGNAYLFNFVTCRCGLQTAL